MAQIHNRKSNFYSQKQSVREELSAPRHLESAGDELIQRLAKKQTSTSTSLQEQLEIVQNFEKGFQLKPENRKGVTSLEDFKKHVDELETSSLPVKQKEILDVKDVNELMSITGLSRHELELGFSEKPRSAVSQLYMFAIRNKRQERKLEDPGKRLVGHPINNLKEIEKECFGQLEKKRIKTKSSSAGAIQENKVKERLRKKNKPRKRKRKSKANLTDGNSNKLVSRSERLKNPVEHKEENYSKPLYFRPSLWDIKDMKKWSEPNKIGCRPQALYTIKNGEIIKLQNDCGESKT